MMYKKITTAAALLAWSMALLPVTVPVSSEHEWQDLVARHAQVVVDVYIPGCSECEAFAPHYEAVSNEDEFASWVFAKISFTHNADLARDVVTDLSTVPTVAVVKAAAVGETLEGDACGAQALRELLRRNS